MPAGGGGERLGSGLVREANESHVKPNRKDNLSTVKVTENGMGMRWRWEEPHMGS